MFDWYKNFVQSAKKSQKQKRLYYVVWDKKNGEIEKIDHTYNWAYSPRQALRNVLKRTTISGVDRKDLEAAKKVEALVNYFPDYVYCVEEKNPPNEVPFYEEEFDNSEVEPDAEVWGETDEDTPPITKHHSPSWYNRQENPL